MIHNNKRLIQRVYTNRVYFNKRDQLASTGPLQRSSCHRCETWPRRLCRSSASGKELTANTPGTLIGQNTARLQFETSNVRPVFPRPQPPTRLCPFTSVTTVLFSRRYTLHECSVFSLHNRPGFSFTLHHQSACCDSRLMQEPCGSLCPL
jgi:hypothetical protein